MHSRLADRVRYLVTEYVKDSGDLRELSTRTGVKYATLYRIYKDQNGKSYDAVKLEALYRHFTGCELELR